MSMKLSRGTVLSMSISMDLVLCSYLDLVLSMGMVLSMDLMLSMSISMDLALSRFLDLVLSMSISRDLVPSSFLDLVLSMSISVGLVLSLSMDLVLSIPCQRKPTLKKRGRRSCDERFSSFRTGSPRTPIPFCRACLIRRCRGSQSTPRHGS